MYRYLDFDCYDSKSSDLAGASNIVYGTDKYGNPVYTGYWGKVDRKDNVVVIWDLDKMATADFTSPNWYHGDTIGTGYGNYGSPEAVFIEPNGAMLT